MVTDEQTKEDARTHALEVLKNPVYSSLSAYKNISDSKDFGEIDNEVMDKYLYLPSLKGANDLLIKQILNSRDKGKRLTGNINEQKILEESEAITYKNLLNLKVQDIADLTGIKLDKKYKQQADKYLSDLKKDEQGILIETYNAYASRIALATAMTLNSQDIAQNGLERILNPPAQAE
jgi:hypothetical protein